MLGLAREVERPEVSAARGTGRGPRCSDASAIRGTGEASDADGSAVRGTCRRGRSPRTISEPRPRAGMDVDPKSNGKRELEFGDDSQRDLAREASARQFERQGFQRELQEARALSANLAEHGRGYDRCMDKVEHQNAQLHQQL